MKNHLLKIFIFNTILILSAVQTFAADTYDWRGAQGGGLWNDPRNWIKNGNTQTTSGNYPGQTGTTDIVNVGVVTYVGNSYPNSSIPPVINSGLTLTIASLTYGNNLKPVASGSAARSDMSLTVNAGATLIVTGTILQMHSNTGGPANSGGTDVTGATTGTTTEAIRTTFYGPSFASGATGYIVCNNFQVGDATLPGNRYVINSTHVILGDGTNINILVNNDFILNTQSTNMDDTSGSATSRNSNASVDCRSGTLTINGTLKMANNGYGGYVLPIYAASAIFNMYTSSTIAPILNLGGAAPIYVLPPPVYANNIIDFCGTGSLLPTVNYTGGDQVIYTFNPIPAYPDRYINNSGKTTGDGAVYGHLTFSGSGTKTFKTGSFKVDGNFTLSPGNEIVDLTANNPTLNVVGNFITGAGTTFKNGTGRDTITGNFINAGTSNFGTPVLTFNSTAADTLTTINPQLFTNVQFTGGGKKNINSGRFNIASTGTLTMGTTATELAANGNLTLRSDASGTATVAAITAGSITGNINAERYMTAHRSYRLMSSPVHTTYDSGNGIYNYSIGYLKRSVWLTGMSADFDKYSTGPTLYLYREDVPYSNTSFVSGNFRDVRSLADTINYTIDTDGTYTIPAGNGYFFYYRGSRAQAQLSAATTAGAPATNDTLTATGLINSGQIRFKNWYNAGSNNLSYTSGNTGATGYQLAGNPYPASIDWDKIDSATTTNGIYVHNLLNSYQVINPSNGNYGAYMAGLGIAGTNGATHIISSGAGFYVTAYKTGAQLIFNEGAKVGSSTGPDAFMSRNLMVNNTPQFMRIKLSKDTVNTDDIIINFNSNAKTKYADTEDAAYKAGSGQVSLASISSDNIPLAINQLPFTNKQVIPLKVGATANGTYTINLSEIKGIPQLFDVWMMDNFTKDSVNMRVKQSYTFNIVKSDTTTYGSRRFVLFVRENPQYAYKLINFNAQKADHQVNVIWKTQNEANYTHFTVERSTDAGKTYNVIGGFLSSDQGTYSLLDKNPVTGQNLYRLKQVDFDNAITYSNVVPVMYDNTSNYLNAKNKINVYPNPASSLINLSVPDNSSADNFNIRIMNSSGILVKQVASSPNEWKGNISNLLTGTYVIEVINNKDKSVVGQAKFVKL